MTHEYITRERHSHLLCVNPRYLDETRDPRIPRYGWCRGVWPKKRSSPLLLFRISGRSTEIRWIMHGQSRGVAPYRLFPRHAMHMPGDRWMCQFHRSSVSIRARVIFIDSKITIRSLARTSRHERASHFPRSDKSTANTDIVGADAESATMNDHWTSLSYSDIFCHVTHHRTREQVSYHPLWDLCCRKKKSQNAAWSLRFINLILNTMQID